MIISDALHNRSNGNPISGADVDLYLVSDDSSPLDSTTTDSNGVFLFELDTNPGPMYYEVTVGDATKRHSTFGIQPVRDLDLSALVPWQTIWTNGVNPTYGDAFEVTANGSNLILTVGSGAGIIDGQPFYMAASDTLTVTAAHASLPRIDLAYAAVYNADSADMGKAEILLLAGTPAASPSAPTPTITDGDYIELASIRVDAGVTAIAASGKVTDLRTNSRPTTGGFRIERDNVLYGTAATGLDVKSPLWANYYENGVADIGVYSGKLSPVVKTIETTGAADISTTTDSLLTTVTLPALHLNQTFRVVARADVNGEGVGALADAAIGIKVGAAAITYGTGQRWEHGVDTTHHRVYETDIIGAGATVDVALYLKRTAGTISPGVYSLDVTAYPTFSAGF